MGLNGDKGFLILIVDVVLLHFIFFIPRWHRLTQISSKLCMYSMSTPHKSRTFTVPLAGNGHYQGNSFALYMLAFVMPLHHTYCPVGL